ncbi:hypothetical protein ABPG72_020248 [Tetrahymena utriculariae]
MRIQKENKYIYIGCQNYQSGGCDFFQRTPTGARNHLCKLYKYAFNDEVFENKNPDKNKRLIIQEQLMKINKELRKKSEQQIPMIKLAENYIRMITDQKVILMKNIFLKYFDEALTDNIISFLATSNQYTYINYLGTQNNNSHLFVSAKKITNQKVVLQFLKKDINENLDIQINMQGLQSKVEFEKIIIFEFSYKQSNFILKQIPENIIGTQNCPSDNFNYKEVQNLSIFLMSPTSSNNLINNTLQKFENILILSLKQRSLLITRDFLENLGNSVSKLTNLKHLHINFSQAKAQAISFSKFCEFIKQNKQLSLLEMNLRSYQKLIDSKQKKQTNLVKKVLFIDPNDPILLIFELIEESLSYSL